MRKGRRGRVRKVPPHLLIERGPIPAMTSRLAHERLGDLASRVEPPARIVEVGAWLGARTLAMARRSRVPVHSYDVFRANWDQVTKAAQAGLALEQGQDTEPVVREYLRQLLPRDAAPVELHKGNAVSARWEGPIGMYVDDACKHQSAFDAVMRIFSRWFVEGAWVALMDFFFYEKRGYAESLMYQRRYVAEHPRNFEFVERIPDSSNAIFRWHL